MRSACLPALGLRDAQSPRAAGPCTITRTDAHAWARGGTGSAPGHFRANRWKHCRKKPQPLYEPPPPAEPAARAPHFVIEAGRGSLWDALGELWTHRELLYFLTWRDVKLRYKQTALGALWAVLQPLLMMVVFTVLFGRLAHVPSDGLPYPIFAFAGLVPWQFFQGAVSQSGASLIGNSQLVTKVYFPRMAIPGAAVGAALVDFAIASVILFVMMACYGIAPGAGIVIFPALVAMLALFAGAVGMWMAGMNVKYRDIKYVLPFMLQLWMFATPVIYPASFVPAAWRWILVSIR